jgi:hypothetical protein
MLLILPEDPDVWDVLQAFIILVGNNIPIYAS